MNTRPPCRLGAYAYVIAVTVTFHEWRLQWKEAKGNVYQPENVVHPPWKMGILIVEFKASEHFRAPVSNLNTFELIWTLKYFFLKFSNWSTHLSFEVMPTSELRLTVWGRYMSQNFSRAVELEPVWFWRRAWALFRAFVFATSVCNTTYLGWMPTSQTELARRHVM